MAPSSAQSLQNADAENRRLSSSAPPFSSAAPTAQSPPVAWYSGSAQYSRSFGPVSVAAAKPRMYSCTRRCVTRAALGRPVVPLVKIRSATSLAVTP